MLSPIAPVDQESCNVTHGSDATGAWARYDWQSGARLLLTVKPDSTVQWLYQPLDPRDRQEGAGVEWAHGHLVSVSAGGPEFFNLLHALALSFPSVDGEMRAATGFEGPPA